MNKSKLLIFPAILVLISFLSVFVLAQDELDLGEGIAGAIGAGTVLAFIGAYFIVVIALYVYSSLAFMTIAKKTNTPNAWLAWIPIANIYLLTQIAGVQWWYMLIVLLAPIIPILGYLAALAVTVYLLWKICEKRGKPGWWGILLIIPIVNLVILGILAWGN